ncbi:MAG: glycosyltransferase family 4 protein [Candidatus Nomurabacteria bacterium]|nr:MAG: glycosyltransferase family 4 protein [Candidatus Nomurabacteria bacterium]
MSRILLLNYEFPPLGGGASPLSYELARGFVQNGHSVTVVTMGYKTLPRYEEKDGMRIFRLRSVRAKKEICTPWEQFTFIISAFFFFTNHLKKEKYDVNHTHFLIPSGIISWWLKKKYQLPYVVTSHGSDVPGFNDDRFKLLHKFTGPILRLVSNNSDKIIVPSKYLGTLIEKNINSALHSKIYYIPNGIDEKKFVPQEKKKIILSTGRLLPRKGFQYLINAMAKENLGYELHIAGDGPMMTELQKLASNAKSKIVFHGWLDNLSHEYKELLESAAIYSLVSPKENASVALLEAMSAGCAIITSSSGGAAETMGEAGITIEAKNQTSINEALRHLTTSSEEIQRLGQLARKRVLEKFSWTTVFHQYNQLFTPYGVKL